MTRQHPQILTIKKIRNASELKPDTKLAYNNLRTAKSNLMASKNLCRLGNYSESIILLQQSIEKGSKSFGFQFGVIQEETVTKEIWHYGTKVFRKIIAYMRSNISYLEKQFINLARVYPELKSNESYQLVIKNFSEMQKQADDIQKLFDVMEKNRNEFAKLPYNIMFELLDKCQSVYRENEENQSKLDEYFEELTKKIEEQKNIQKENKDQIGIDFTNEQKEQTEKIIEGYVTECGRMVLFEHVCLF